MSETVMTNTCIHCDHTRNQHEIGKPSACLVLMCRCTHFEVNNIVHEPELRKDMFPPQPRLEHTIGSLLVQLGLDATSEGLRETPRRVAGYLREFTQNVDLPSILKAGFEDPTGATGAMVVQDGIPFRGCCEHHLLPFHGTAAIGYIPKGRIVGLSKLTRLVQAAGTRKPSTQEEISNTIADVLDTHLQPVGVIVLTEAIHTCMAVRGVNAPNVASKVSTIRGVFRDVPSARSEFFAVLGR